MSNQLLNHGETLEHNGNVFEVTGVSSQDGPDGQPVNLSYHIRLQAEVEAERQAEREAVAEAQKNQDNQPTEG